MTSGLESLHKVLKDETRRKILRLLDERGSLSYTDLMNTLGISSTGKHNYHLKTLNELVQKNQEGQYALSEKGRLALRLMQEFSAKKSQAELEAPFPRGYMIVVGLLSVVSVAVVFGLLLTGLINTERFVVYMVTAVLGIMLLVVAELARTRRAMMKPKTQMWGAKIAIIGAGAVAGGGILFFGGGLLLAVLHQTRVLRFPLSFGWWIIVGFSVGAVLGGLVGYWIYRRSKFSKMSYYDLFAQ
jgi:DNA-binding transcriptional ArsR family regulator